MAAAIASAALVVAQDAAHASDPTTADCLAANEAALKLGNQHRLRAERSQLLVCAAATCPADVRKECIGRVDQINAQIPTIAFSVKDVAGADTGTVKVTMDGEVLAERLQGTSISIDPGEHTFTFEAAGQPTATRKLVIVQGQKDRREVVTLGAPGALPADGQPGAPGAGATQGPTATGGLGTQKVLALVAGAIGLAGVGIGTAFGVMTLSKKSDAQNACPGQCATQDGVDKWSDAGSAGNVATIAFIAGGVALAGAATLWLTAPGAGSSETRVGLGPGGIQVRGSW